MPFPRHIRLRQHKRMRKPQRVAGLFDFQLSEARLNEGVTKLTIDRRVLNTDTAGVVSRFVGTFLPGLRYWNPGAAVELLDAASEAPTAPKESPISMTLANGDVVPVTVTRSTTPEAIFEQVASSPLPAEALAALAGRLRTAAEHDGRKRAQLSSERQSRTTEKATGGDERA